MMSSVYSKFCGITSVADAREAVASGCDAIGLVLVESSPRHVSLDQAAAVARAVQDQVEIVLLFVNPAAAEVELALHTIGPDIVQFHGSESEAFCQQWGLPYWKAVPMQDSQDIDPYLQQYPSASAWLLDNYGASRSGGSGEAFEWFRFPPAYRQKLILAGGLNPENIQQALRQTGAVAVDVSSGIEQQPGIKSARKMQQFIQQIRSHDN